MKYSKRALRNMTRQLDSQLIFLQKNLTKKNKRLARNLKLRVHKLPGFNWTITKQQKGIKKIKKDLYNMEQRILKLQDEGKINVIIPSENDIACELITDSNGNVQFNTAKEKQFEWSGRWIGPVVTYAVVVGSKDAGILSKLRRVVGLAFTTWEKEIPINFKRVKKSQNPDIILEFVNLPGSDRHFKKRKTVLAYAYYPGTNKQGIVKFNDYAYEWGVRDIRKSGKHIYNVLHVTIHELGHSIGLSHATHKDIEDFYQRFFTPETLYILLIF